MSKAVELLRRFTPTQPLRIEDALYILTSPEISQQNAFKVLESVRKNETQSAQAFQAFLIGTARRGDKEELDKSIELVTKNGITSPNGDWRHLYMQLHASKFQFYDTAKILGSYLTEKKVAQLDSRDFAYCVKRLGTDSNALSKFTNLWNSFLKAGAKPDALVRLNLIKQFAATGDAENAGKHLLRMMQERHVVDETAFWPVIASFARKDDDSEVQQWLGIMRNRGYKPSDKIYNGLIDIELKKGNWKKANRLLKEMKNAGFMRSVITYNSLINSAAKQGDMRSVEQYLKEMKRDGVQPNTTTFSPMIAAAAAKDNLGAIQKWINLLLAEGLKPTLVVFRSLVSNAVLHGNLAMVQHWLREMATEGVEPDLHIYTTIVNLAVKKGDYNSANFWLQEIKRKTLKLDVTPFNILIRGAMSLGEKDSAKYWLAEMLKEGINPNFTTFSLLVGDGLPLENFKAWLIKVKEEGPNKTVQ